MTLGLRLKAARLRKNMTQADLETASGVKQGTISKIERGDQEQSSYVVALALALDVDPGYLYNGIASSGTGGNGVQETHGEYPGTLPPELRAMWGRLSDNKKKLILGMIAELIDNQ